MNTDPFSYTIQYNNILFIASLRNDESKTGKWLYDDLISYTYRPESIAMNYTPVRNKKEFIEVLMGLAETILNHDIRPILHLDVHGDENGFELNPSEEFISWKDFCEALIPINIACRNNLIIFMNVCKGFYNALYSFESLLYEKPCPFLMCIGPQEKIIVTATRDEYQLFYRNLFATSNFSSSFLLLNKESHKHDNMLADNFVPKTAGYLRSMIYSREYKNKAADELQTMLKKGDTRFLYNNFKKSIAYYLRYKREWIIKNLIEKAEKFLMADIYPELEDKFQIKPRITAIIGY